MVRAFRDHWIYCYQCWHRNHPLVCELIDDSRTTPHRLADQAYGPVYKEVSGSTRANLNGHECG